MDIHIFQMLDIQKPKLMLRLLSKTAKYDIFNILDLEDALWDVNNLQRTQLLKARGRLRLLELFKIDPDSFDRYQLGVRLNRISSPEFRLDLEILATISHGVRFSCLILPKVESPQDILLFLNQLDTYQVKYDRIVPIIETCAGLENLATIISEAAAQQIRFAIYGHYDYSLDAGCWPFLEQEEDGFWNHILPIIRTFEAGGLGYIHPPYFHIYKDDQFTRIMQRLQSICQHDFGVLTLGARQTGICYTLSNDDQSDFSDHFHATQPFDQQSRVQLAETVIDVFEQFRKDGDSFALDPMTGRFISPHVYLAARAFLEGFDDDS